MKVERGCTSTPAIPLIMDDEELERCPRRPLLDYPVLFSNLFDIYYWYGKGHFPDTGSWTDQAAALIQSLELVDKAANKAKEYKQKIEASKVR